MRGDFALSMEEHQFVLPSNVFSQQQTAPDIVRSRPPLIDSPGNAQYHIVGSSNLHDEKGLRPRPPLNFTLPTLLSQPARQHPRHTTLEARRSHIKTQREHRSNIHNPILESDNYRSYRSRQIKESSKDQKWPDDLEELFLEALCLLPPMGRRKYSLNGKPHGRNELISLYLWLGYLETVAPGEEPDLSRHRVRKQVSSHIQVLKGFMRGHPAYERLFPPGQRVIEDSFKNDPCLRALSEGRLPHRRRLLLTDSQLPRQFTSASRAPSPSLGDFGYTSGISSHVLRPALFMMYMTTLQPGVEYKDVPEDDAGDGKLSKRVHTFSDSVPQALGNLTLDTLPNWRVRFPLLAQLQLDKDLKCDIIHMEVTLELRYGSLPERSELWGKFELLMHSKYSKQQVWSCTQSLHKPADLHGTPGTDPRYENITSTPIARYDPGVGTYLRVSFPASPWAHALQRLSTMEAQFEEAVQTGAPIPTPTTARQYIDQITMYQEIFCSESPNQPFVRKAIMLWTFKKCKAGERGKASWRYLDPTPSRSTCFSPRPDNTHFVSAVMTDNFSAWVDDISPYPHMANSRNIVDSVLEYAPPPSPLPYLGGASEMQFSFPSYTYPSAESLSFMSQATQDSDTTLVDITHSAGSVHLDNFLSSGSMLGNFDHSQALWEGPPVQGFDNDPEFLAGYGAIPPNNATQIWDAAQAKNERWDTNDADFAVYNAQLSQHHK